MSAAPSASDTSPPALQLNGGAGSPTEGPGSRAELWMTTLKKLRPYPLRHQWVLWHESGSSGATPNQRTEIEEINTVQRFWQVFNNTPFSNLPPNDWLHLFKKDVKPIWEDERNKNGGAWTFRVPKSQNHEFWKEILVMAIGEILQEVVEKGDDICGVSFSVRFNSHLILIWTRDADNETSRNAVLARVMENLPAEMRPRPQNTFYKKHSDHKNNKPGPVATSPPA